MIEYKRMDASKNIHHLTSRHPISHQYFNGRDVEQTVDLIHMRFLTADILQNELELLEKFNHSIAFLLFQEKSASEIQSFFDPQGVKLAEIRIPYVELGFAEVIILDHEVKKYAVLSMIHAELERIGSQDAF